MKGLVEYWRNRELDDADRKLLDNVEQYDCHILLVGEDHPRWAYSVGLTERFDHPEIVVFGLPPKTAQAVINGLVSQIREGIRFEDGDSATGLLQGDYVCRGRAVQKKWYEGILNYATWFNLGDGYSAVQCLWPDLEGKNAWDSDFRAAWVHTQPLLYLEDPEESRMGPIVDLLNRPSASCKCGEDLTEWTFGDDPHRTSFTQRHVADGEAPILLVCHDQDDDEECWQFLDGSDDPQNPVVLCLHHLIDLDPTLQELSDLPLNWQAWRSAPGAPWERGPRPSDGE